jgi:hypothetical protein
MQPIDIEDLPPRCQEIEKCLRSANRRHIALLGPAPKLLIVSPYDVTASASTSPPCSAAGFPGDKGILTLIAGAASAFLAVEMLSFTVHSIDC